MPPTVQRGTVNTYTDRTLEKRDISEAIDFLDPFETPMLNMVGKDSLKSPCTQIKHKYIEDNLIPRAGTLAAAYTAGTYQFTLAAGQGKYLYIDDVFLVGAAIYRVQAGPPDLDVITVILVGGTDANIANGAAWTKLAHSAQEGGSAQTENRKTVASVPYNYTQILKDWAITTGTMNVIKRYGYASERAYNEAKVLKNIALDFEFSCIYGVRSFTNPPRKSTMGGLYDFVYLQGIANSWRTVYNAAGGELAEKMLNDQMQIGFELGAHYDFIMVNGTNKRRITSWMTPRIRNERTERTAGASVGSYESDFGMLDIVLNRNLRASDVILGTKGQLGIGPLNGRQMSSRLLPTILDGTWWEILGEYTMEVHRASVDFQWIYNTSTVY